LGAPANPYVRARCGLYLVFISVPPEEHRRVWREAWEEAKKDKAERRRQNTERWLQRKDWASDEEATPVIPALDDPSGDDSQADVSGSLADLRA
jgi:hypothetical protein